MSEFNSLLYPLSVCDLILVANPVWTQDFFNWKIDINVVLALPTWSGEDKNRPGNSTCTWVPLWGEQRAGLSGGALVHMLQRMADAP